MCKRNGNNTKWYTKNKKDNKLNYLSKKQRIFAEKLANQKYLTLQINDLLHEKEALELYLSHHNQHNPQAELLLQQGSPYHELLESSFTSFSSQTLEWINSSYEHNTKYPAGLIHKSISGNTVRSKSESLIDMALYLNKIPFRYECALYLNDITFYPDFTIYHPLSGEIYYWEHFGMMDNPSYSKDAFSKQQLYNDHGIIPSINLITTYETKNNPLTGDLINQLIKYYFL